MKKKAELKYSILFENYIKKNKADIERMKDKLERKQSAYIKKKETEYKRKMANEIRELEWKPKRVYKTTMKMNEMEFALKIAQENARLRDTNAYWYWYCISCGRWCRWDELAWWHRYSRRFKNMCLETENINAQCHTCNFTTWPRGNSEAKLLTNTRYDENLEAKCPWSVQRLKNKVVERTRGTYEKYDLDKKVPELIEENENLRKGKEFYKPAKKWREIWHKWLNFKHRD